MTEMQKEVSRDIDELQVKYTAVNCYFIQQ